MNSRFFGCGKYRWLSIQRADRLLNDAEMGFYLSHREQCPACREEEELSDVGLSMLRGAALEPVVSHGFDDRVVRRLRVQQGREGIRYWSPVLAGAVVAGLIFVAALQLIAGSGAYQTYDDSGSGVSMRERTSGSPYGNGNLPLIIRPEDL